MVGMENKEKVRHWKIKGLKYMTTIVIVVVTRLLGKMAALIALEKVYKVLLKAMNTKFKNLYKL